MRLGALVPVCLLAASAAAAAATGTTTPQPPPGPAVVRPPQRTVLRHHPMRPGNLVTDLDAAATRILRGILEAPKPDRQVYLAKVNDLAAKYDALVQRTATTTASR